jgi:hypothetical protein
MKSITVIQLLAATALAVECTGQDETCTYDDCLAQVTYIKDLCISQRYDSGQSFLEFGQSISACTQAVDDMTKFCE